MAMAMRRRTARLDAMSRYRDCLVSEVEQRIADRLQDVEERQGTGLFWQSVDRLFKHFPAMDLGMPKEVVPGAQIGPCTLGVRIGEGSFGTVYGAQSESGSREAIKVIPKATVKHRGTRASYAGRYTCTVVWSTSTSSGFLGRCTGRCMSSSAWRRPRRRRSSR